MQKFKKYSGFTLIELLVVIAIIGILAAVVLVSLSSARAKSRDARRISDMHQVQTALELYFNDTGGYPATLAMDGTADIQCGTSTYMVNVPKDPSTNTYTYTGLNAANPPVADPVGTSVAACGGNVNIDPNYRITFTTEQPGSLGNAGNHTADNNGIR